uniref:dolichol kinase n=1 Tax=Neobodo designis TaxID=312471 RepID=A0A7S1KXY7_NEODS|mmetsp:Transcript_11062/g.34238  ORF Transcript_11062/g.34238 Transcript_11062/m.34238 type:complete len:616 (+) Transcript_11062:35-1882(+)|eukprot:CAMPEP_0174841124 /NCGR_PEP_ID=MMETSP1114-20130205/9103_1 /TAXON_ID=312471 /ORGANISM="Neobodo designis, Strain CCAP 1951/1" /LENGTH=615 /DNA_ID=CAMNT_0016075299 /DNA_START=35 /DNA_END=1882 /DNA_ORIENTATION=+
MRLSTGLVLALVVALGFKGVFGSGQLVLTGLLWALAVRAVRRSLPRSRSNSGAPNGAPKASSAAASKRTEEFAAHEIPPAALLLVAAAAVAEKLDVQSYAVAMSAMPTYVTLGFAFVCSTWGADVVANGSCDAPATEQRKQLFFGTSIVAAVLGMLTLKPTVPLAIAAAAFVAFETFHGLRKKTGATEAFLVASLCAWLALDVVGNNDIAGLVPGDDDDDVARDTFALQRMAQHIHRPTTTTVEHVLGRGCLEAAWLFCWLFARVTSRWWSNDANRRHAAAAVCAALALAAAACHVVMVVVSASGGSADVAVRRVRERLLGDVTTFDDLPNILLTVPTAMRVNRFFPTYCVVAWLVGVPIASLAALFAPETLLPRIVRRKLFHFIAVAAFVIPTALNPPFMAMWWCIAVAACSVIEALRSTDTFKVGTIVTPLVAGVIDTRDAAVVRTHLYLMAGCGISVVLNNRTVFHFKNAQAWYAVTWGNFMPGLGALGVLDAAAACAGVLFGGPKLATALQPVLPASWSASNSALSHKSVAGTIGGCVCAAAAAVLPLVVVVYGDAWLSETPSFSFAAVPVTAWARVAAVSAGAALYEAVTDGVDNLELPLFTLALCRLLL